MPQEIYNEGRVVGLSAWEIFKRDALGSGIAPEVIPDESQWLTAMIGAGASMILKVPANTPKGVIDFELPAGSNLAAAGIVVANPFIGSCEWDTSNWAKKVKSYGSLIENTAESCPTDNGTQVPYNSNYSHAEFKDSIAQFLKITDGIVYTKKANWITTDKQAEVIFPSQAEQTVFTFEEGVHVISITSVMVGSNPSDDYVLDNTSDPNTLTFNSAPGEANITVVYRTTSDGDPQKDIDPNFNVSSTVIRLYINDSLSSDVSVLFTGFINKRIIQGLAGHAVPSEDGYAEHGSTDTVNNNWPNGAMLGPEITPWANKIIFTVPSSAYNLAHSLTRILPSDTEVTNPNYSENKLYGFVLNNLNTADNVKANSFVDFNSIDLLDYYKAHENDFNKVPTINEQVSDFSAGIGEDANNLTAWYPGLSASEINNISDANSFFPPALYASQVSEDGQQSIVPLDTAAPGTIKGFENSTQAAKYKAILPDNYSMYYNPTTQTFSFATPNENDSTKWPGLAKINYMSGAAPKAEITAGQKYAQFVALTDPTGQAYDLTGGSGTVDIGPEYPTTWDKLLSALAQNKTAEVVGARLRAVGTELKTTNKIGIDTTNDAIAEIGAAGITVAPGTAQAVKMTGVLGDSGSTKYVSFPNGATIRLGQNFIQFGNTDNALKFYISDTEPTGNIPEGSIGIGW